MPRGRFPGKRIEAAAWLSVQPWFADWTIAPDYREDRVRWRQIANAVREAGFFSKNTGTIDVPVQEIVVAAIARRDVSKRL